MGTVKISRRNFSGLRGCHGHCVSQVSRATSVDDTMFQMHFLDAFAKLRIAIIRVVTFVCLSVCLLFRLSLRMEIWTGFHAV
jgi:hypothetical protein